MTALMSALAEGFDLPVLDWIAGNLRCGFLDAVMPAVTVLGDAGIFWICLSVLFLCLPKYRRAGLAMGISLLIGLLVCNVTLKPLVARPRPYDYLLEHYGRTVQLLVPPLHDFSFPSGHTLASFEAAAALARHNRRLGIPALILASLIAFSRLYLYVHYPTDVLFGLAAGIGIAFLGDWLAGRIFDAVKRKKEIV